MMSGNGILLPDQDCLSFLIAKGLVDNSLAIKHLVGSLLSSTPPLTQDVENNRRNISRSVTKASHFIEVNTS